MSTVIQIIDNAREDCGVDNVQIPDAQGIKYFNRVYHEMENCMVDFLQENFQLNGFTANLVAGTHTYALPGGSGSSTIQSVPAQVKKLVMVELKYVDNANVKYYKAQPIDFDQFVNGEDYYESAMIGTVSQYSPRFMIRNYDIKVYPTPITNVPNGLRVTYNRSEIDLTVAGTEAQISIPWQFHYVITLGIKKYIYAARIMTNEKNDANIEYTDEKKKFLSFLADRYIKPASATLPPLNYLAY